MPHVSLPTDEEEYRGFRSHVCIAEIRSQSEAQAGEQWRSRLPESIVLRGRYRCLHGMCLSCKIFEAAALFLRLIVALRGNVGVSNTVEATYIGQAPTASWL